MLELDALCKKANLPYWTSFGSLTGALSRNGFIPWDDDIDICMTREDIDKLKEICANNPDYQLALVYDGYAFCRQVRFSSRNRWGECYARCRDRGMPLAKALKALARKRLKVICAIMRDKIPCAA